MRKIISCFIVGLSFCFMCSKNNNLDSIRALISNGEYESALTQLETILEHDSGNVEANELKIRATMLKKSNMRNQQGASSVPDKKKAGGAAGADAGGVKGSFSIMSLCGDGNAPDVDRIQRQLNAKKVN